MKLTALQDLRRAQVLFQLRALALVFGMPAPEPSKADSSASAETQRSKGAE